MLADPCSRQAAPGGGTRCPAGVTDSVRCRLQGQPGSPQTFVETAPPADTLSSPAPVYRRVFESDFTAARAALLSSLRALRARCPCACLLDNVEIVVAEVINNIIEHAHVDCAGRIELSLFIHPGPLSQAPHILCSVRDDGAGMPGEALPPGIGQCNGTAAQDSLAEGGFGWQLIRTLAQDIRYRRRDGLNQLDFCVGPVR